MTAQIVTDALVKAIWRRGSPMRCYTPNRSSRYASEQFQRLTADNVLR